MKKTQKLGSAKTSALFVNDCNVNIDIHGNHYDIDIGNLFLEVHVDFHSVCVDGHHDGYISCDDPKNFRILSQLIAQR